MKKTEIYNEAHAQEWMEKHPYGYYNNEGDYGQYTDYTDDHFGVIVYKYINDDEEHTEEYDDADAMRADYIHMIQDNKDDYEYVVMQEVTIDSTGYEHIEELDSYYNE